MGKSTVGMQLVSEPVSMSLGILASVLSIAASIKQLIVQGKSEKEAFAAFVSSASPKDRRFLKTEGIQNAIHEVLIISPRLLKQLSKEAQDCENRHLEARARAETQIDKDVADTKATECVCNVLRALIKFNGMKLPPSFESMWKSYGCSR